MRQRLLLITVVLLATFGVRSWLGAPPRVPRRLPLADFPTMLPVHASAGAAETGSAWNRVRSEQLDANTMSVLKANDYLLDDYRLHGGPLNGAAAQLFVAYYYNQSAGDAIHSPKNCLPGGGWEPVVNDRIPLGAPAPNGKPGLVNRYVVENSGARDLVLYWYQAQGRIIASEYSGKFYLVWDAMRERRRDGAIVRVIVGIPFGQSDVTATKVALSLARASEAHLPAFLPN
ncbi:MAG: exosortase C-terminal domain/associated protein EpsI [Terriglobales bacterium]